MTPQLERHTLEKKKESRRIVIIAQQPQEISSHNGSNDSFFFFQEWQACSQQHLIQVAIISRAFLSILLCPNPSVRQAKADGRPTRFLTPTLITAQRIIPQRRVCDYKLLAGEPEWAPTWSIYRRKEDVISRISTTSTN